MRPTAALLLMVHLSGCYRWQPSSVGPIQLVQQEHPRAIRFKHPHSSTVVVEHPTVRNDSIFGATPQDSATAVAADQVRNLEIRRFSAGKTAGLVLGVAGAAALVVGLVYVIALNSCDGPCFD